VFLNLGANLEVSLTSIFRYNIQGESSTSEQSYYGLRKKQKINYNEEQILESPSEEGDQELHSEFSQAVSANFLKIEVILLQLYPLMYFYITYWAKCEFVRY